DVLPMVEHTLHAFGNARLERLVLGGQVDEGQAHARHSTAPPLRRYRSPVAGHAASPSPCSGRSSRSPCRLIQPICRAGTPTTSAKAGTSRLTTAPAPTKAYGPTVVPHTMVQLA